MIILQILIMVVILLLSTDFIIGSIGSVLLGYTTRNDQPDINVDDPDPTDIADSTLTNYPILKF